MTVQIDSDKVLAAEIERLIACTPRSAERYQEAQEVMPGGETRASVYFHPYPVTIVEGSGVEITDLDGNIYLDFLLNYTTMILGYGNPLVKEAAVTALGAGSALAAPVLGQVELARELTRRVPSVEQIRFANSGTEATLLAVRAARAFTGRPWVIKMIGGYHGSPPELDTRVRDGVWPPGVPATSPVRAVPFNDPDALWQAAEELRGDLAAIILEPVMGSAGIVPPAGGYLQEVRRIADEVGAVMILDEVIAFRLSPGGYQAMVGVRPDLTCFGKIIGGGFPVGAVGGRREVMEVFAANTSGPSIEHAGTFNGNPVTMAAGYATLQQLDDRAYDRLRESGGRLARGLERAIAETGVRACLTHVGSLVNVHFANPPIVDADAARARDHQAAQAFHLGLLNRGIFIAPRGMFATAVITSDEQIDRAVAASRDVFAELAKNGLAV